MKNPNEPVDLIPVPSGLLAYLLLIRFAGRRNAESRDKSLGTLAKIIYLYARTGRAPISGRF